MMKKGAYGPEETSVTESRHPAIPQQGCPAFVAAGVMTVLGLEEIRLGLFGAFETGTGRVRSRWGWRWGWKRELRSYP